MRFNKFFIAAFAVLFVVSLTYAILSWVMTGFTEWQAWVAPVFSGIFLVRELHEYAVKP